MEYASAKAAAVEAARASAAGGAGAPTATTAMEGESGGDDDDAPPTQLPLGCGAFDLVLMNPPFGTQKGSNGVDMRFLRVGLALCAADGAVYSLNKTSTRSFIAKTAASWGARSHAATHVIQPQRRTPLSRCCDAVCFVVHAESALPHARPLRRCVGPGCGRAAI